MTDTLGTMVAIFSLPLAVASMCWTIYMLVTLFPEAARRINRHYANHPHLTTLKGVAFAYIVYEIAAHIINLF